MTRFRSFLLPVVACVLLTGCSHQQCEEAQAKSTQRIRQLEGEAAGATARAAQASQEVASLTRDRNELREAIAQLTQEISAKDAEIAAQSQTIEKAKAYVAKLTNRKVDAKPNADPLRQSKIDDMIHKPLTANADLFPISISNQRGKTVLVGTHKETNWERGAVQPYAGAGYGHWDTDKVRDFGFKVTFTARNLTKTPKTFSAEAGGQLQVFSLGPGQSLDELGVDAIKGNHLQVTCGSEGRTVTVPWQ